MKVFTMILAGVAGLALGALGAASALTPDDESVVQITEQGFSPDRTEIETGQKVVWRNATGREHNITCTTLQNGPEKDKLFDSGPIRPGQSFDYTFMSPGTFEYYCALDESMKGTVVVKPAK